MTSRGVAVTSRGAVLTSCCVESAGAVVFVRFDELGRDRDSVKEVEKCCKIMTRGAVFSS